MSTVLYTVWFILNVTVLFNFKISMNCVSFGRWVLMLVTKTQK